MKHEQVVPDYWVMLRSSATCLLLVFSGYVLIRMVQAIFWLPGHLQANQKKLEEMVAKYEKSKAEDKEHEETKKSETKVSEEQVTEPKKEK